MKRFLSVSLVVLGVLLAATAMAAPASLAVFVPGVAAGSPLYEQMVSGANKVAAEFRNLTSEGGRGRVQPGRSGPRR